jgi:VWFA-related protein
LRFLRRSLVVLLCASHAVLFAQAPPAESQLGATPPAVTIHAATHLVTVEVVARDHQGHAVTGLTQGDFQVIEQVAGKHEKQEQKIAVFRAVNMSQLAAKREEVVRVPPGVFTNVITTQKDPFPPTVLLIDGLNTEATSQMQVHRQMVRMLASIPDNVPVAIFLLGHSLRLIQNFTTDPKLLKDALQKAASGNANSLAQIDPRDDPDNLSAFLENIPADANVLPAIERFERENYAVEMDQRVQKTIDALRSIARYIAGYPGRKNLLWVSSSFPIMINPDKDFGLSQMRNYHPEVQEVANALSDANVSLYPMDPAGVRVQSVFNAGTQLRGDMGSSIDREEQRQMNQMQAMQMLAEQTGGRICVNDNDLGDCVKKAVEDGSSFYEIAYYPDATGWHGEFHKIIVKTSRPGAHLAHRQGYYARTENSLDQKSATSELQRAACLDLLTSTSITLGGRSVPADSAGTLKYLLVIDPKAVIATPVNNSYHLALQLAICMFDKSGKPLQFMQQPLDRTLTAAEYASVRAQNGLLDSVVVPQNAAMAGLRLLVRDSVTGRLGSVNVPVPPMSAQAGTGQPQMAPAASH